MNFWQSLFNVFQPIVQPIIQVFQPYFAPIIQPIYSFFQPVFQPIYNFFQPMVEAVQNWVNPSAPAPPTGNASWQPAMTPEQLRAMRAAEAERERQQQGIQAFDEQHGNNTGDMVYGPALPSGMEAATNENAQAPVAQLAERPEFTGDELLAALETTSRVALSGFLNYVTADGWDIDAEGSPAQKVQDLFKLAAGVTTFVWTEKLSPDSNFLTPPPIDEGISPLTIELLNDQRNLQLQSTEEAANELIADVLTSAERDGIDLGNIDGKSAREVLEIYLNMVAGVSREEVEQQNLDGGYWVIDDPGEVTGIFDHWRPVLLSFGVAPEINTDVMEWVEHNFINVDASDPRQVETAVRAYLTTELAQGVYLPDDPDSMSISSLAYLVNAMQGIQGIQARQEIGLLYEEANIARQGSYPSAVDLGWAGMVNQLSLPDAFAVGTHPEFPIASQQLTDVMTASNVTGQLNLAFAGQYDPPPDLALLMLVGSVVFEPIDWVATGVDIIGDLATGNILGALLNAGLAIAPGFQGWMDDVAEGVGDLATSSRVISSNLADIILRTDADPFRDILGAALSSERYGEEVEQMIKMMEAKGVDVEYRSGTMAYTVKTSVESPYPSKFIIDPEASIGSWRHEFRHFQDDMNAGFQPYITYAENPATHWNWELNAYMEEIKLARELNMPNVEKQIIQTMISVKSEILAREVTMDEILGEIGTYGK